jgi:hypothetical protein
LTFFCIRFIVPPAGCTFVDAVVIDRRAAKVAEDEEGEGEGDDVEERDLNPFSEKNRGSERGREREDVDSTGVTWSSSVGGVSGSGGSGGNVIENSSGNGGDLGGNSEDAGSDSSAR